MRDDRLGSADLSVRFEANGLRALRQTLRDHSRRWGAPRDLVDDLLIVASELAGNAIRHGGGVGVLTARRERRTLYCRVSDDGPGICDPTVGTVPPDPTGGEVSRGLWICRALSDTLTFTTGPAGRGTIVTATLSRPQEHWTART